MTIECPTTKESNNFPQRLHEMLEQVELHGLENVVSWLPENKAFKVHDPPVFVQDVLPNYFAMTKYKSFLRQLNIWNFSRIKSKGPDDGAYQHELFVRGKPSICSGMKRIKIKGLYKRRKAQITPPPTTTTFASTDMMLDLHKNYSMEQPNNCSSWKTSSASSSPSRANMMPLQFQALVPYDDEDDYFSGGRVTPKLPSCSSQTNFSEFPSSPTGTMVSLEESSSPSSKASSSNASISMELVEQQQSMVSISELKYVWLGMELAKGHQDWSFGHE